MNTHSDYPPLQLPRLQRWWSLHSHAPQALAIKYTEQCDSTNAQLYRSPSQHNTLFVAERQIQGRGQFDRRWQSRSGDLIFSLGLQLPTTQLTALSLRVGWAVAKVCHARGWTARLKWPNDVILNEGKLAGILVQSQVGEHFQHHWVVIGVGLNVASRADEYTASAFAPIGLSQADENWLPQRLREGDREALLLEIVDEILLQVTGRQIPTEFTQRWNGLDIWRGAQIQWNNPLNPATSPIIGIGQGINATGEYLIETEGSLTAVHNGQIRFQPQSV